MQIYSTSSNSMIKIGIHKVIVIHKKRPKIAISKVELKKTMHLKISYAVNDFHWISLKSISTSFTQLFQIRMNLYNVTKMFFQIPTILNWWFVNVNRKWRITCDIFSKCNEPTTRSNEKTNSRNCIEKWW